MVACPVGLSCILDYSSVTYVDKLKIMVPEAETREVSIL
jgi:hypothetical protein